MKKPSEWTPQEAWRESAMHHMKMWGLAPHENELDRFPADPVERVSDRVLQTVIDEAEVGSNRHLMALELIERRKGDKEQGK